MSCTARRRREAAPFRWAIRPTDTSERLNVRDLPVEPPFVLPSDADAVARFHAGEPAPEHRLHLELFPEPFLGRSDAPVVLLNMNPGFSERDASGAQWWAQHLGALLARYGRRHVANTLLCVEYFPYHSERFRFPEVLPSQTYGFSLVRSAIARGAVIVVLRARSAWLQAVPELGSYVRTYTLRNHQRVWITEGNCPDGYATVLAAIATASSN